MGKKIINKIGLKLVIINKSAIKLIKSVVKSLILSNKLLRKIV